MADGGLFGTTMEGGLLAFRIKNLDTGESVHVKNTPVLVDESKLNTFGPDDDDVDHVSDPGNAGARSGDQVGSSTDAVNPGLSVTISGTEPRRDSEGRIFTAYVIKVEQEGSDVKWAVVRRYRDFFELDKMVRSSPYRHLIANVVLPRKKWFGSMTPSVIRERQRQLQKYIDWCVASLPAKECAAWGTFLELNIKRTRGGFAEATAMTLKAATDVPGLLSLADAAERYPEFRL